MVKSKKNTSEKRERIKSDKKSFAFARFLDY